MDSHNFVMKVLGWHSPKLIPVPWYMCCSYTLQLWN